MNDDTGHDDDATGHDDPNGAEGDTPFDGEGSAGEPKAEGPVSGSEADDGDANAEAESANDQKADEDTAPAGQSRFADLFDSPAMKAMRDQQRRLADMLDTPAMRAVAEQQRRLARMADSQGLKALAQQQRRLADILDAPAVRAMAEQQRRLAALANGPAFEPLHENLQIAKLTSSPAIQVIASQQRAWKANPSSTLVNHTLRSPAFRNAYLETSRSIAEAFSRVEIDPGWKRVIRTLQASPEVTRWANSVADAIQQEGVDATDVQRATEALAESPAMREALEHAAQSDTTPLEDIVAASANALEAAQAAPQDEEQPPADDLSTTVGAANAETFRALIKLWGASHVVMVVVLAAIVTGQPLVILLTLAALSDITGYSLRDLMGWLGRSKDQ